VGAGFAGAALAELGLKPVWAKKGENKMTPRFSTGTPDVINTAGNLSFSLPLINSGTEAAANLWLTDMTLNLATRLIPAGLPVFLGNLAVDNIVPVNGRFHGHGLLVGGRYLITVRGTYEFGGVTYGFNVNHDIIVPPPVASPIKFLNARVDVAVAPGVWSYQLFNDEASDSPQFINSFSLDVVAPVIVTGRPRGWADRTDNASYVLYSATDQQHRIAPGASLGGFEIQSSSGSSESTGFSVTAWNHQTDQAGLVVLGAVLSPSRRG
jgi:hypothetical protein